MGAKRLRWEAEWIAGACPVSLAVAAIHRDRPMLATTGSGFDAEATRSDAPAIFEHAVGGASVGARIAFNEAGRCQPGTAVRGCDEAPLPGRLFRTGRRERK
jgi:hypothetical protein